MVDIPPVREEPQWKKEFRERLGQRKTDAKRADEEWGKRWFLSLAVGNAGGLLAMSTAALNLAVKSEVMSPIYWAILPSAWCFAGGLVAGAVLPFCWKKKVEKVSDWVWVREQELEDDGPTQVWVDEEPEFSSDLLKDYEAHQNRWEKYFNFCERSSAIGFLAGLFWTLGCFTVFVLYEAL